MQLNEGISWGRFDEQGFCNPQVVENPNILILGSSHMEGTYMRHDQRLAGQLQQLLGPKARVYNMGISGHDLKKCLQYLPKTLAVYEEPPKLIIIEASDVLMTEEEVQQVLDGTIPSAYHPKPQWMAPILTMPFLLQMARQTSQGLIQLLNPPRKPVPAEASDDFEISPEPVDGSVYDPLFQYLQDLTQPLGVQVLIFFHPGGYLQEDGSVFFPKGAGVEEFSQKCREYGVGFLDLTEKFQQVYQEKHLLPHGFMTSRVENGHLNAAGHQAAAEEIVRWIRQKEEQ